MSSSIAVRSVALSRARNEGGPRSVGATIWTVLWSTALATRLWAAFYLPNAEQDGYSDAETIARFSASLASGEFRLADLYGFWLPLFQFVAAVPNIWLGDALLAGKIVSSLCGAVSCVLTFSIAYRLTRHLLLSCAAFVIVLLNPLHLLYSAACMTDVPFACLTLASLWFLLKDRWLGAALCAALAGCVRVEAWALIPLLPFLQFIRQRRVSSLVCALLLFPPLGWLVIGQLAQHDWFAFFTQRVLYHAHYMDFHPSRRGFTLSDVQGDIDYLLLGGNRVVFLASLGAALVLLVEFLRRRRTSWACFATVSYLLAIVGLLVAAYVTKRQPVWLPRYGLFALVLGLPLLAWMAQRFLVGVKPVWLGWAGVGALFLLSAWGVRPELPIIPHVLDDFSAHARVANALVADLAKSNRPELRCFSDDVAVRVLSGLPIGRFLGSTNAPRAAWENVTLFETYMRKNNVGYVVFMPTEDSLPVQLYPALDRVPLVENGRFQLITSATSSFGPGIWLYRWVD